MDADDLARLEQRLSGTADSIESALGSLGLDEELAEEAEVLLSENEFDRCHGCGWWFDWIELDPEGYCLVDCSDFYNEPWPS